MIRKTSNRRYHLLEYQNEFYLLDMDSNKFTWFFPFLVWFISLKAYKVDKNFDFKNSAKKKENSQLGGMILGVSVLSAVLIRILDATFWTTVYINNKLGLVIILFLTYTITLFVRYYSRFKKNEHEFEETPIYIRIHFTFRQAKYFSKLILPISVIYSVIFFMCTIFTNYGNFLPLFIIVPLVYLLSIINTTILPPEKIKDIEFFKIK